MRIPRVRAAACILLLGAWYGCQPDATNTEPSHVDAPKTEVAIALHQALGRAATAQNVSEFKRILTPASVRLLDSYFRATAALDSSRQPAVGWFEFMEEHAALAPDVLKRAPYPVQMVSGQPHLAIDEHAAATFFRDVASMTRPQQGRKQRTTKGGR